MGHIMSGANWRLILYLALVLLPVVLATFLKTASHSFAIELGKNCALMAFMILMIQFIIAARIKWMEKAFGFDILIRFHKHMGIFALALLLAHPLLIAIGGDAWRILIGLDLPWYIWLGKAALVVLVLNILLSGLQTSFHLKFENWRRGHDILGPLILGMGFFHSWVVGDDMALASIRGLWIVGLLSAASVFLYHITIRPQFLKKHAYDVIDVHPETTGVWTIRMRPPEGKQIPPYLPGQFHFVTFYRGKDLPVEEHHWTISSSPTQKDHISSTIKNLGDFTATIGETRKGDKAAINGPFGRFSYLLRPQEKNLVLIAGGIGITPFMSMLRHMRDTRDTRSVCLMYANKKESDIVFYNEISEMQAGGYPQLKVFHILSEPNEGWEGETGHVNHEKIERLCGRSLDGKVFYVCGPPPMLNTIVNALKNLHVPDKRIRIEIFSFLD